MARLVPLTIVVLLLFGAFAIACGGSDGSKVTADTPEEYASAVCGVLSSYADDFEEMGEQFDVFGADLGEDSLSLLDELLTLIGPLFSDLSGDLDDIEPPSAIADQHTSIVEAFDAAGDAFDDARDLLDRPLAEALEGLSGFEEQFADVGEGFEALADPGPEYDAAFEDEPACQELEDIFGQF